MTYHKYGFNMSIFYGWLYLSLIQLIRFIYNLSRMRACISTENRHFCVHILLTWFVRGVSLMPVPLRDLHLSLRACMSTWMVLIMLRERNYSPWLGIWAAIHWVKLSGFRVWMYTVPGPVNRQTMPSPV
jgi:hypothetical protein